MLVHGLLSIIIPSRNEPYLQKTIQDLTKHARGDFEILAVLDGYWPPAREIVLDNRVHYIHFAEAKGMRNAINSAVKLSRGQYILKTDAHCSFSPGFDVELKKEDAQHTIQVPRRLRLNPVTWSIIQDHRPPIDYMYLDETLKGREWREKNLITDTLPKIDELMTSQGSCWFMSREYFDYLEILDEATYGTFFKEMQEIGLKCWLSGGKMLVNKNVGYAHWHKERTRGYSLSSSEDVRAIEAVSSWKNPEKAWSKQIHDLKWLFNKFGIAYG